MATTFKPPVAVANEAQKALDVRDKLPPSRRGMTPVGVRRASQLAGRKPVSFDVIERMVRFFLRTQPFIMAEGWKPGEDGYPSKSRQADWGWGGRTRGFPWARGVYVREMRKRGKRVRFARVPGSKTERNPAGYLEMITEDLAA